MDRLDHVRSGAETSDGMGILSVLARGVVNVPEDHNRVGALQHASLIATSNLVPQSPESFSCPNSQVA